MTTGLTITVLDERTTASVADARPSWRRAVPGWLHSTRHGESTVLIALGSETPVGVAELLTGHVPELRNVGVLPAHQGQGIGAKLVREAERRARPQGRIRLRVGLDNPRARGFYERLGYRVCGETATTAYDYVDDDGVERRATETDEWLEKELSVDP